MQRELSVLIVEDEEPIRQILTDYLGEFYATVCAENGEKAWQLMQEADTNFDVVISDIHMPKLSGIDLLCRIRTNFPGTCVIIVSGTSEVQQAIEAVRMGAYDYISKPIGELEEIRILIQRWQQLHSLETKLEQYASLHNDIMQSMKVRTFMAVDVVGSRALKDRENPLLVHYSFLSYQRFIEEIVLFHGGLVHSTAGDGVMTCFKSPQAAKLAAEKIQAELTNFNSKQNRLHNRFRLRIGIHTGSVIIEGSGRVNEMYSEALDITGHIQKSAEPNHICLSEGTREVLLENDDLILLDQKIDGFSVYSIAPGASSDQLSNTETEPRMTSRLFQMPST